MKRIFATCIAAIAISSYAGTFETDDGFTITLPAGWVEIPGTVLQDFSLKMDELSPETPLQVYDYGFQMDSGGKWLAYPYILVQVRPIGRIPSGQLARYKQFTSGMEEDIEQLKTGFPNILSDASMGEPVYDDENKMLWTSLSMDALEAGNVKALVGMRLTEMGIIQLTGYASEESYGEYESIFKDAFSNLVLDERIEYQPQITDTAPVVGGFNVGKLTIFALQAVVIGGVLWVLYYYIKRLLRQKKAV